MKVGQFRGARLCLMALEFCEVVDINGAQPQARYFIANLISVQGFTQKHPNWLHLKTSPGWQRITPAEVADAIRELLACCAWAFDAMIVAHSMAPAKKSLPMLFIKVLRFFGFMACAGSCRNGTSTNRGTVSVARVDGHRRLDGLGTSGIHYSGGICLTAKIVPLAISPLRRRS